MKNHPLIHFFTMLILIIAILACNFSVQSPETDRLSTVEAMETSISGTSTAAATLLEAVPTEEQAPPTATQEAAVITTTQEAPVTSPPFDMSATQTAIAPFLAELPMYGVDPQQGQLGWVQPPISLEVDQFHGSKFDNKFPWVTAADFVMESDITWDTEYGGSGCAFAFRSDGDQQAPNQYMVITSRLANGHVAFALMAEGELIIGKDFYANGIDPKFDASNGATNRLTVVGRGMTFTIYSNGALLGDADPNDPLPALQLPQKPVKPSILTDPAALLAYQQALAEYQLQIKKLKEEYNHRVALWSKAEKNFPSGYTALGVVAQSGRTLCEFNNSWLWLIGSPSQ